MIANGILFKADFDMSKYTEQEILKQFNPADENSFDEEIQATANVVVTKETVIGKDFKMISYKSDDTFVLEQILESSRFMEEAAPRLLKVIEINPKYFLVAFPYYPTSCEFCEDYDECDHSDFLSEEDEDKIELSRKIEDTIKELARITMYFIHENTNPKVIQDKISDYVSLCFKFTQQDEELVSMDDIAKDLEQKLLDLWKNNDQDGDDKKD